MEILDNYGMTIKEKRDLVTQLNRYVNYTNNLSSPTYEYLMGLINLEKSALEETPNLLDLVSFKNTQIFKDIVTYNIYSLAQHYCEDKSNTNLQDEMDNIKIISYGIKVFDYSKLYGLDNGEVDFYQKVYDPDYIDMMDEQIEEKLNGLYRTCYTSGEYNDVIKKEIEKLEHQLKDLRYRNIPNKEEQIELDIYKTNYDALIGLYHVNDKGFEEAKNYGNIKKKTLSKDVNGFRIYNNKKYF